ncbi:MAG: hypothetical protein NZL95_07290 [Chitinophagales bacterium]|nr:hypothetical protein [Chitinophagales bacterium]MDW8428340.1 hypothetical protein [Chitinophagales bacterium]
MAVLLVGCSQKKPCSVPCVFGTCEQVYCICLTGYEGDSCHIRTVDRYLGQWKALDSCETTVWGYSLQINSKTLTQVNMENFGGFGTSFSVTGHVFRDTLSILQQTVQGIRVYGKGTVTKSDSLARELFVFFTLADEWGNTDTCRCWWQRSP